MMAERFRCCIEIRSYERHCTEGRNMTTTYRKKTHMTWLFWWPFVLTIGLWSANASAWCDPELDEGFHNCYPNNPPGDTSHSYAAYIGSDPNDDYTQWIAWYDLTTDQCNGWDMIGGLGGSGGLDFNTRIIGLNGNDYLTTMPPGSSTVCGYVLTPPVSNGYGLYFRSDWWNGGYDQILDYTNGGEMYGSGYGTDFYSWTTTSIYGGSGNDNLWKWGSPGLGIYMGQGNDTVHILSATYHSGSCGGQSGDYWCGPGLASGCATVVTTCP
jgi:hypothetical protein